MLLIFVADDQSPRLLYILNEILFKRLQITYTVTDNYDYFMRSHMPKINYSSSYIPDCVNIPAHTLLYQENIRKIEIEVTPKEKFQFTFFDFLFDFSKFVEAPKQQIPFDIFSASFYLLSRYEEYIVPKFDTHQRFKAEESLAYKHHFLQIPLVDIWAMELGNIIQKQYPEINYTLSEYHEIHSFDIDFAYKYKGLSKFRFYKKALGNMLRFNFSELIKMFDQSLKDEYDTYDFIFQELEKQKVMLQMANKELFAMSGFVETVEADFNNETGNIAFRAAFPNPKGILRHGETGNIMMPIHLKNAIIIPQKSTFDVLDKKYVYLVDANGVITSKEITIAQEIPHFYVLASGLKPTDKILLEGLGKVKNNEKIKFKFVSLKKELAEIKNIHAE